MFLLKTKFVDLYISPDSSSSSRLLFQTRVCFEAIISALDASLSGWIWRGGGPEESWEQGFSIYSLRDPYKGQLWYSILQSEPGCTLSYSILLKIRVIRTDVLRYHSAVRERPLGHIEFRGIQSFLALGDFGSRAVSLCVSDECSQEQGWAFAWIFTLCSFMFSLSSCSLTRLRALLNIPNFLLTLLANFSGPSEKN